MKRFICLMAILALGMVFTSCTSNSVSYVAGENTKYVVLDEMPVYTPVLASTARVVDTLVFTETEKCFYYDYKFFFQPVQSIFDGDFVTAIFDYIDSKPSRFPPGRTGFYIPLVPPESARESDRRIFEAINNGIPVSELRELIHSIKEYQWHNYPLHFSPFRSSCGIMRISNSDGTIYFQRD